MDRSTVVMYVLAVLWFVAIMIGFIRWWQTRLTPLTKKARDRYVLAWERIEARFLYAPQEAVREADGLVMPALRARHHPPDYELLPRRAKPARRKLSQD